MPELTEGVDVKDCPFCGGNAILYPRNNPDGVYAGEMWWFFMCRICGAQSKPYESKAAAIAAWNARAEDAAIATLRARVAELEAAQRWIPVTERLPEIPDNSEWEDRFVLCTFENPDGRRYVLETHYLDGEFSVGDEISIDFTPPNYIGQMYEGKDTKLVAWMYKPLPQPPEEVE